MTIRPAPSTPNSPRPSPKVNATLYATKHSSQNEQSFGNSITLAKNPVIVFKWPQLFQTPPQTFLKQGRDIVKIYLLFEYTLYIVSTVLFSVPFHYMYQQYCNTAK